MLNTWLVTIVNVTVVSIYAKEYILERNLTDIINVIKTFHLTVVLKGVKIHTIEMPSTWLYWCFWLALKYFKSKILNLCFCVCVKFCSRPFALFGLDSRGWEIVSRVNIEEMLSLWKICTWCYMVTCSCTVLGPKMLLANVEFLLVGFLLLKAAKAK